MRNVMWEGQLGGTIDLDTITSIEHLYGLGPLEGLKGEIMILEGKAYVSTVVSSVEMRVVETFQARAPFFVYAHEDEWNEYKLPETVVTLNDLESYLLRIANTKQPFVFKLKGVVDTASIHVVNLPDGAQVSSPQQAHQGQVSYNLNDVEVDIVGFFSKSHQSVFTHHDTFMHLHLITADRSLMGHLDSISFKLGEVTLYLPK